MTVQGPDRGYSWIIVICCAYIHFAMFGLFRSWGVIYVAVLHDYQVTREEASWPFSLCSAVFQLIGPAVSVITHYFSKRATCLLGCTIATIGVIGCYFAENVMWITIFYGVIHGIGFGIVTTLIPVFLNQYFVKHRATALGFAFSGGSISSLIAPIVMEWLLENYNLRGSFLLLGGMVMNTLVASALLRPPPWLRKTKKITEKFLEDSEGKDSGVSTSGDANCEIKGQLSLYLQCEPLQDSVFIENKQEDETEDTSIVDISQKDVSNANIDEGNASHKLEDTILSNDSIFFGGSVSNVCGIVDSKDSYKVNNDGKFDKTDVDVQKPLMNGKQIIIMPKSNQIKPAKSSAHHSIVEILRIPIFHLITFSMFIFFLALQSFLVVIVDYARDKGIPETDGVFLLSIFSITDLCGRSCLGWITDRNYVRRKSMIIFNLIGLGVILQLYPGINDFTGLLTVAAFHGICTGSCITLFFVLQAEYLGTKNLTLVVGLTSFITGALTLFRPAMIGLFRDTIGSYDWMFHSLGILSITFAFIWLIESWISRNKKCPTRNSIEHC